MGRKTIWMTPELAEAINDRYDGSTKAIDALVAAFNVPRYTVTSYAVKHGLTKKSSSLWSESDRDLLINNWIKGAAFVAKKLKRTEVAVTLKAKRMGLGGCVSGSHYLTGQNVANMMGVDIHAVLRWLNNGWLKWKPAPLNRKTHLVELADLESFLRDNQTLWDSRKMKESLWLTEPEWLKEKRRSDRARPVKEAKKWTKAEDMRAIAMFKTGNYKHRQIGEALGRSSESIERRLSRLDVWGTGEYIGQKFLRA